MDVSKPTLLVVDDEPDIGEFVQTVAEKIGFNAVATDCPETFKQLYDNDFQVVVIDLIMPGVDGVELIRFLADEGCQASIVLISGFDASVMNAAQTLATAQGLKVIGSLAKPFKYRDLAALIGEIPQLTAKPDSDSKTPPSEEELRAAISGGELVVYYQPKVLIAPRSLVGVEALVRWQNPRLGFLAPNAFIPLAEESGLIDELTTIVLEQALGQCRDWLAAGIRTKVSVNMSSRTLTSLDIPERIVALVERYRLETSQLVLEVTETALLEKLVSSLDILTRLRMKGIQLSIDDFGTGYSSLQQLQRVPFTELKIDRSFLRDVDTDKDSSVIVEIMIELGHKLGMTVVAEGIETAAVWNLVAELGCDEAQGYFIGKPMPGAELAAWLRKWN